MNSHDMPLASNATVMIIRVLLIAAVTLVLSSLVPLLEEPAQAGLKAVTYALAAVVAVLLLRPQRCDTVLTLLAWCAAGACLAAAILMVDSTTRMLLPHLPGLLLTLFLLAATFSIATRFVPVSLVITLFILLTLMPVWAAPLVEVTGNPAWLNKFVLSASPLTATAVAIDLDYLRSEWFYANSAIGSMRFRYPGWTGVCLLLAVLPVAAVILERLRATPTIFTAFRKEAHP